MMKPEQQQRKSRHFKSQEITCSLKNTLLQLKVHLFPKISPLLIHFLYFNIFIIITVIITAIVVCSKPASGESSLCVAVERSYLLSYLHDSCEVLDTVPMITCAPSLAMWRTTSQPIPLPPPVTMATLPSCLGITGRGRREHTVIRENVI